MMNLQWPPRTCREMEAWQNAYGTDARIAAHLGITDRTVKTARIDFDVAPLSRAAAGVYAPKTSVRFRGLPEEQIAVAFGAQRFENIALDPFTDRPVRGA